MQSREFDNLMNGESAKALSLKPMQIATLQDVKQNEQPIPKELSDKIQAFIQVERNKGTKERAIRRMVKSKFNIVIVRK